MMDRNNVEDCYVANAEKNQSLYILGIDSSRRRLFYFCVSTVRGPMRLAHALLLN